MPAKPQSHRETQMEVRQQLRCPWHHHGQGVGQVTWVLGCRTLSICSVTSRPRRGGRFNEFYWINSALRMHDLGLVEEPAAKAREWKNMVKSVTQWFSFDATEGTTIEQRVKLQLWQIKLCGSVFGKRGGISEVWFGRDKLAYTSGLPYNLATKLGNVWNETWYYLVISN